MLYLLWAEQAQNFIDAVIKQEGILGKRNHDFRTSESTPRGAEKTHTEVHVTRRTGEYGFSVKFEPSLRECLTNGKAWTDDGAVAALKHCFPDALVTTVFGHTNQIIATVTFTP